MMSKMLLFAFISYGMTTILVYGSIFESFRKFLQKNSLINIEERLLHIKNRGKMTKRQQIKIAVFGFLSGLFSCVLCTSTWVGFFLSLVIFSPVTDIYNIYHPITIFFDGMFSAGIVWSINAIVEWFEENRPNDEQII